MAQTVKSLLRLSMSMRNFGMLTNYTITKRFIQISTRCCDKVTLVSPRPHLLNEEDHNLSKTSWIASALNNFMLTSQVFDVININKDRMTWKDAVIAMETLTTIEKGENRSKIHRKEEFIVLCELVKKSIRLLGTKDLITVLKVLVHFDVPMTSVIAQTILQMLRQSINELSLNQISYVHRLLDKGEMTVLSEALIIALPIVYENNVLMHLDREDISAIRNALVYLARRSKKLELFTVLMHAIREYKRTIEPSVALTILWGLCDLEVVPDGLEATKNYMFDIIARGITSLRKSEIKVILQRVTKKIRTDPQFYDEGFTDACASVVITEDWGFEDAMEILHKISSVGHSQILLLDYIAGKCFENPSLLETCAFGHVVTLIDALAAADYKPVFWEAIQDTITNRKILDEDVDEYPLLKLALSLLTLDCYCPQLLDKVFTRCNKNIFNYRNSTTVMILSLYQIVKTLYPQYNGQLVDHSFIEKCLPSTIKYTEYYSLIKALECALGGRRYVLTNVKSKLGHVIDHVVVMRKGGFPVAINHETDSELDEHTPKRLEDLKPPLESQVILIMYAHMKAYSRNTQRMTGTWCMRIKSLEALSSYTVIPIPHQMWVNLSESEKIPYLMQAIRIKCDEISVCANS